MIDHELTDPAGGALTITHDHQGVWITATEDRDEVTVGPFPVTSLTEAVTVESDAEVSGDLMDGGVTAAAIEAEVVSPERARSLVQENTELRARIGRVEEARDLYRRDVMTEERLHGEARRFALAWKETARELFGARNGSRAALRYWQEKHDHPLTADDITDGMLRRGVAAYWDARDISTPVPGIVSAVIRAALTPPPSREAQEAAKIEAVLAEDADRTEDDDGDMVMLDNEDRRLIGRYLAERGVRVTGAES